MKKITDVEAGKDRKCTGKRQDRDVDGKMKTEQRDRSQALGVKVGEEDGG